MFLWELYLRMFLEHPLVGAGMFSGRVTPVLAVIGEGMSQGWGGNQNAHNWVLQCLGDTGILGLVGFGLFLWASLRGLVWNVRQEGNPWRPACVGMLVGLVMVTIHGLMDPNYHGKPFLYFVMLVLGVSEQMRRVLRTGGREDMRGRSGELMRGAWEPDRA